MEVLMPAKLSNEMPKNGLFVVKNTKNGMFYSRSFKMKQSAKERRNELNVEAVAGLEGYPASKGPWIVTKGVDHIHYAG
jgi:hypothetical protein